ncbi:MAG: hypothetical protein JJU05_02960 [Verrucomicrobia bacterium]|nr:hypothetical protein [Verrucomicrobiota bacterium]MCH8527721.1 DUF6364 family protein [Kiritimatiellia bacterium]
MKTRITLTIDPGVSHRAKEVARREGVSLSAMVEKMLLEVSRMSENPARPSFSERWRGRMVLKQPRDTHTKKLHEKYGLETQERSICGGL